MPFGKNKKTWELLVEDFDLNEGVSDALKDVVGTAIEKGVKKLAPNAANQVLMEMGLAIFKPVIGEAVVATIKAMLGMGERIQSLVEKQIQAPYKTGTRMIHEAMELKGSTSKNVEMRSKLLYDGILKLEDAWELATGMPGQGVIRFHIRFLQGLAAVKIEGGEEYAQPRIQESYDIIMKWVDEIDGLVKTEEMKIAETKSKTDEAKRQSDAVSYWAVGYGGAAKMGYAQRSEAYGHDIPDLEKNILKLNLNKIALMKLATLLKATGIPIIDSTNYEV